MDKLFYTPEEMVDNYIASGEKKARLPLPQMILLGILAGACIAIGGVVSNVAVHGVTDVGLARILAGVVFPVGLMLVVITGAELFTGNSLMIMTQISGRAKWYAVCRNLIVVYFSNFIGALIVDYLVFMSGQLDYSGGGLGAYTIKVAVAKSSMAPQKAVASGILCNVLVCLAILASCAAKDITGKIWGVFFPIFTFVTAGFEHCVANMFYIPEGMMAAQNKYYVALAGKLYGITPQQTASLYSASTARSFIFVTLGNLIGGMLCVGVLFYAIYKTSWKKLNK